MLGGLLHIAAVTPLCKTNTQAALFRFAGYAAGILPVLLREDPASAVWMAICLIGWAAALQFIKGMLK